MPFVLGSPYGAEHALQAFEYGASRRQHTQEARMRLQAMAQQAQLEREARQQEQLLSTIQQNVVQPYLRGVQEGHQNKREDEAYQRRLEDSRQDFEHAQDVEQSQWDRRNSAEESFRKSQSEDAFTRSTTGRTRSDIESDSTLPGATYGEKYTAAQKRWQDGQTQQRIDEDSAVMAGRMREQESWNKYRIPYSEAQKLTLPELSARESYVIRQKQQEANLQAAQQTQQQIQQQRVMQAEQQRTATLSGIEHSVYQPDSPMAEYTFADPTKAKSLLSQRNAIMADEGLDGTNFALKQQAIDKINDQILALPRQQKTPPPTTQQQAEQSMVTLNGRRGFLKRDAHGNINGFEAVGSSMWSDLTAQEKLRWFGSAQKHLMNQYQMSAGQVKEGEKAPPPPDMSNESIASTAEGLYNAMMGIKPQVTPEQAEAAKKAEADKKAVEMFDSILKTGDGTKSKPIVISMDQNIRKNDWTQLTGKYLKVVDKNGHMASGYWNGSQLVEENPIKPATGPQRQTGHQVPVYPGLSGFGGY